MLMSDAYGKCFWWSQKLNLNCIALLVWVTCVVSSQAKPILSASREFSRLQGLVTRIFHYPPSSALATARFSYAPLCTPGWEVLSLWVCHLPRLQNPFSAHSAAGKLVCSDPLLKGKKSKRRERRQSRAMYRVITGSPGAFCLCCVACLPLLEDALGRDSVSISAGRLTVTGIQILDGILPLEGLPRFSVHCQTHCSLNPWRRSSFQAGTERRRRAIQL